MFAQSKDKFEPDSRPAQFTEQDRSAVIDSVFLKVRNIVSDWLKTREELAKDTVNIGVNDKLRELQDQVTVRMNDRLREIQDSINRQKDV